MQSTNHTPTLVDCVREEPMKALAITLGVGIVIGLLPLRLLRAAIGLAGPSLVYLGMTRVRDFCATQETTAPLRE